MRLKNTKLSLNYGSLGGDLIEVFRVFNKLKNIELKPIVTLTQTNHRKNGLKNIQRSN